MTLKFTYDQISTRYEEFIKDFMSAEESVEKVELLPRLWVVAVPSKNFKVTISCECIGHIHGVEEWCAVAEEESGQKNNYLLFEEEIEKWLSEQRKIKGFK